MTQLMKKVEVNCHPMGLDVSLLDVTSKNT